MNFQDGSRLTLLMVLSLLGMQAGSLEVTYSDERRERHPLYIGGSSAALVCACLATSTALYDSPGSGGNRCLLIIVASSVGDVGVWCDSGSLPSPTLHQLCHLVCRGINRLSHHILPASLVAATRKSYVHNAGQNYVARRSAQSQKDEEKLQSWKRDNPNCEVYGECSGSQYDSCPRSSFALLRGNRLRG